MWPFYNRDHSVIFLITIYRAVLESHDGLSLEQNAQI